MRLGRDMVPHSERQPIGLTVSSGRAYAKMLQQQLRPYVVEYGLCPNLRTSRTGMLPWLSKGSQDIAATCR